MITNLAFMCLSLNIYYEAGIEPIVGKEAVALVTINRAKENEEDICTTVYKHKQFSWTGKKQPLPKGPHWVQAKIVTKAALTGKIPDFTHGATYYYAEYIKPPRWKRFLTFCGKWGSHLFYKKGPLNVKPVLTSYQLPILRQQGQSRGI